MSNGTYTPADVVVELNGERLDLAPYDMPNWCTDAAGGFPLDIHDQNGLLVARVSPLADSDIADRIVACVNACAEMPTELLTSQSFIDTNIKLTEFATQCDELSRHITEWLCDKCRTVHTAPVGFDLGCKTTGCDGVLRPSSSELRKVEAQRDSWRAECETWEKRCVAEASRCVDLQAERDELLAALELISQVWDEPYYSNGMGNAVRNARAAIAKAKGGAA